MNAKAIEKFAAIIGCLFEIVQNGINYKFQAETRGEKNQNSRPSWKEKLYIM